MKHASIDIKKIVRIAALIVADGAMTFLAGFLAVLTRMEFSFTAMLESGFLDNILICAPLNILCTVLIFALFRLYASLWEYTGGQRADTHCPCVHHSHLYPVCGNAPDPIHRGYAGAQKLRGSRQPVPDRFHRYGTFGLSVRPGTVPPAGGGWAHRSERCSSAPVTQAQWL